ncbi:hypothetical protein [Microbacterium algeriense]|uniref:MarR family transcriptional regulator n=1 Tax=Microbacterium algeriense TaxID=2615184 RepID=A0ABQ6VA99_9MICO|nr:hypothetical protein [Microbacterium algeriense]KAB1866656.1 hypothetical protein F6A08_02230 [Microbacterium algeriense]
MNTPESQNTSSRPFGYWLKAADRLMAAEFAAAFEGEHLSRRDWRILNIVDGTTAADRPLPEHKLHRLIERGWIVAGAEGWTLTDEGRSAKERLGALVDGIRAKVSDAVSDEDMATTLASLEKIARAFGWDEETPLPRGRGHRFGGHGSGHEHGHGFPGGFGHGRDFGHGRGFDHGRGFGHGHGCEHGRGHGPHGGHHRAERLAQHAFERGFDAGFSRGRDA